MKFRKKPVVIDAYLYSGDYQKAFDWAWEIQKNQPKDKLTFLNFNCTDQKLYAQTLEGSMEIPVGNYIICGVEGELYSCEPNIFHKTYERVEE